MVEVRHLVALLVEAAALQPVAGALAIAIREKLASGELVVVDGKVASPDLKEES
ncbi:hypothetical protein ACFLT5_01755 [Chloroflexota bacterium]